MAPKKQDRQYEIVLLGATGYTGSLVAEHIVQHLPTNLQWAIAGRSKQKLEHLAAKLAKLAPDRVQPVIEIASLNQRDQLDAVMRKTTICISVVSYSHVGTQVVEACVENGTDYLDTNGTVTQFGQWFSQYHEKAKASGTALIHACGAFSAPQDLLTWLAVRQLREHTALSTEEVILVIKQMSMAPSGGTVESIFHKSNVDPEIATASRSPWFLSPLEGRVARNPVNSLGIRKDPYLGVLVASAFGAHQDRAVVHRTWGLLQGGKEYGPNFHFNEYEGASSNLQGVWKILSGKVLGLFLSLGPVARLFLPKEGDGPDPEISKYTLSELEAVAVADGDKTKKAFARFKFVGSSYHLTAAALAQGAASLLYKRELEGGYEGGNLTPAMLGEDFVERLRAIGADIDMGLL
ncbi:putative Saccharopine dehydrogenase-domain-containing protein [Seiridium cardinale]